MVKKVAGGAFPERDLRASADSEADAVEEALRDRIVTLRWKPGQVLSLPDMTEALGCGVTPLRLALERIAQQGLVALVPRKGVIVTTITIEDFRALYEFVVPGAEIIGRMAAERIDESGIRSLEEIRERYRKAALADDSDAKARLNTAFAEAVARATGNPYMIHAFQRLVWQLERCSRICISHHTSEVASQAWHDWLSETEAVIAALRERDAEAAARAMAAHAIGGKERQKGWL